MTKRIRRLTVLVSALAVAALSASVIAQASPNTNPGWHAVHHGKVARTSVASTDTPAGRTEAQGAGSETPETASSETPAGADGPGGHADEPGNTNADHQFQGNE